jgi:hypothetical protein
MADDHDWSIVDVIGQESNIGEYKPITVALLVFHN